MTEKIEPQNKAGNEPDYFDAVRKYPKLTYSQKFWKRVFEQNGLVYGAELRLVK